MWGGGCLYSIKLMILEPYKLIYNIQRYKHKKSTTIIQSCNFGKVLQCWKTQACYLIEILRYNFFKTLFHTICYIHLSFSAVAIITSRKEEIFNKIILHTGDTDSLDMCGKQHPLFPNFWHFQALSIPFLFLFFALSGLFQGTFFTCWRTI